MFCPTLPDPPNLPLYSIYFPKLFIHQFPYHFIHCVHFICAPLVHTIYHLLMHFFIHFNVHSFTHPLVHLLCVRFLISSCADGWNGTRCQNRLNFSCPVDQIICKVGNWFCGNKTSVCNKGASYCNLSPNDFNKICPGRWPPPPTIRCKTVRTLCKVLEST